MTVELSQTSPLRTRCSVHDGRKRIATRHLPDIDHREGHGPDAQHFEVLAS